MPKPLRQVPRQLPDLSNRDDLEAMRADAEEMVRAFVASGVPDYHPSWRAARAAFFSRYPNRADDALRVFRRAYFLTDADLASSRCTTRRARP